MRWKDSKAPCREQGRREDREADLLQERHNHQVNRSHHRDDQGCGGRVRFVGVLAPDLGVVLALANLGNLYAESGQT